MSNILPTSILGRTDLEVTSMSFGAMEICGTHIWGGCQVTSQQAKTILNAALDKGIYFIDNANDYEWSEECIG
jgi:aryl-alcohol dehydrogenase-like predicted oxidoreductase